MRGVQAELRLISVIEIMDKISIDIRMHHQMQKNSQHAKTSNLIFYFDWIN